MELKWQLLRNRDRNRLLLELLFDVMLNDADWPEFMTQEDCNELRQNSTASAYLPVFPEYDEKCYAHLDLELLAIRYWVPDSNHFFTLIDFLQGPLAQVKVQNVYLFESINFKNLKIWVNFNMEAVFLWMSNRQVHS